MTGSEPRLPTSLIVATRGRPEAIEQRLPVWASAGFDEVIIVDATWDQGVRARMTELSRSLGVKYVPIAPRLWDTRSFQRNFGARVASGTWILFQDDDDDVMTSIDKEVLRRAACGRDWLVGPKGVHIVLHRRNAFLSFGGYPEDMVAAEDGIMSNRARGHGRGGLVENLYGGLVSFPAAREDPISRARNGFFYGYTSFLLLLRYPRRKDIVLGEARRLAHQLWMAKKKFRYLWYAGLRLSGHAMSPLHCLHVLLKSGVGALKREPYFDWQGLR